MRLIDADKLYKYIDDEIYTTDKYAEVEDILDIIAEFAEETPYKWIPVVEGMPKDKELVLFSTRTNRVFEGRYFDDNTSHQWYSFRDDTFAWNNVVTAWMPLPKPYRTESEGNNEI